jgi:hypothetical protein
MSEIDDAESRRVGDGPYVHLDCYVPRSSMSVVACIRSANSAHCWSDLVPFYQYFHSDSGAGIGASHQTGWTGFVARLIQSQGSLMKKEVLRSHETPEAFAKKVA